MLAPSTKITSNKIKYKWAKIEQDSFNEINRIVARNILLTYTDFNETFRIHTMDSNFQIGAVIIQKGKAIAFYVRKLADSQNGI